MDWIWIKELLPKEYQEYIVCILRHCSGCDSKADHFHRLNFCRKRFDIASWDEARPDLVGYYQAKGDSSWDHYAVDSWNPRSPLKDDERIEYWMYFDNEIE